MTYYHGSPVMGLQVLKPGKPAFSEKPERVYLTTLLPMALLYGVQNYEYTYGFTREGQIYLDEYFPNALEVLYRGKRASVYVCDPAQVEQGRIPNEVVSAAQVPVIQEMVIPDLYEALLEQERLGALVIRRFDTLPPKMLAWIRKVEADGIRRSDLLHTPGPMADYYRTHYPESWQIVETEET